MSQMGVTATPQYIQNSSFNPVTGLLQVEIMGWDGQGSGVISADKLQIKSVSSGGYNYFCFARPGTAEATAKWQCFRLDDNANLMYADGNSSFDNAATSPETLTYSYE